MSKLLIIDGHFLAMKSHFSAMRTSDGGLLSPQGAPINVCTGFLSELGNLIRSINPSHLLVAFDSDAPNFRSEIYPEYKAGRQEKPVGFAEDLLCLQDILTSVGVCAIAQNGYEGDDIIASATKFAITHETFDFVDIYSPDKDLLQLLDEQKKIAIIKPTKEVVRWRDVVEEYGIKPSQIVDYKSLAGDPSDNIKGAKGIGAKQAVSILGHYNSVDEILQNLDNLHKITAAQKKKIRDGVQSIKLAQKIVKLVSDLPILPDINSLHLGRINILKSKDKINDLGLGSVGFRLATILESAALKLK